MTSLRRFLSTGEARAGLAMLLPLIVLALLAPVLFPGDPMAIVGQPLLPPFQESALPLGTDRLGRDVLAQLVHGAQTSLLVGLAAALSALCIGAVIGTIAGFGGRVADEVLMRITEAFQTVPAFLLALAFVSVIGPTLASVVFAIALGAWPAPARVARAEVLSIREKDYVAAARVVGKRPLEIAFREILPNALPPVLALSSVIVASAILIEAALSFLGLGDPNRITWGGMIAEGRTVLRSASYLSIIPGIALVVAVLAVYLLGEGAAKARLSKRSYA
ncbi:MULTISPECIES: ABC transporter permease [Mesorhizobium]|uniref:ABC transporter permease n=1 Tax=Mesorhizobium denitrificans TaxID=2294114 RepID=A0A371XGW1_9HYPH|nr:MULTISPECIES: ABC transporter permease [Mesorhizobium]RFC68469.1 ABC transporter permease [Mesorhizobium denitrificans]